MTHGRFEDVADTAQTIKGILCDGANFALMSNTKREALGMIATKLARIANGNPDEPDHWRDIAGYAKLVVRELDEDGM